MKEFKMTQEEMDEIISINRNNTNAVMFLSGGQRMGISLQERINNYWKLLGDKYGFKYMSVKPSPKGGLYFLATEI